MKRLVDFSLALLTLPLLLPLIFVLTAAIRLSSRGPAIMQLTCIGLNGTTFRQYRFRVVRADSCLAALRGRPSAGAESHLTRLGSFLLLTGLNRLPQLFNVLKGDMSLIGPRAVPAASQEQAPDGMLAVRPGIVSPDLFLPANQSLSEDERQALSLVYAANADPQTDGRIVLTSAARFLRNLRR